MKHIFVINPAAGQGKSLDFIKAKIETVAKKYELDYEVYITEKKGDGIEYVEGDDITFVTTKAYTNAKVMVWDNLTTLKPVCNVEIVK